MPFGFCGKILRIDLGKRSFSIESPPDTFYRRYFGGRALIAYYLLKNLEAGIDPLGPENILVFSSGVMNGHPFSGSGRNSVGAKSPLTGGFGNAEVGGFWGSELKRAGYDAIIVSGVSEKPIYLSIKDEVIDFRNAEHIWGKTTGETEVIIKKELDDNVTRVAQIGPAGERMIRYACIVNDLSHVAGRTGLGAVMGSKKLKAIAVRGSQSPRQADPEKVKSFAKRVAENPDIILPIGQKLKDFQKYGTAIIVLELNENGGLPTRNFLESQFESAEDISGERMTETILIGTHTCFSCAVRCKRNVKFDLPYVVDPKYGGPEYETIAAFGSNCGIKDLKGIAKAHEICNAYGIDTISTGIVISFVMECYQKGVLKDQDTGGVQLKFGDTDSMLKILGKIVECEGIGEILKEGVRRAAEKIGRGSEKYAMHVKSQEIPLHEPRLKKGLGIGYAISPTGADHAHNLHDTRFSSESIHLKEINSLGFLNPIPKEALTSEKIRLLIYYTNWRHFLDCAVMCYFTPNSYSFMPDLVNAVTGWNTTTFELMKVGERAVTMARAFNIREGFTSEDDVLPDRFSTSLTKGPIAGESISKEDLERSKTTYYRMMGWEAENGVPTAEKLYELDVGWIDRILHVE